MNLIEIREKFKELSGRYDLVNDDNSDNGANFFINEGSKYLDRLHKSKNSWTYNFQPLAEGEYVISIPYCRAISKVIISSNDNEWEVERKSLEYVLGYYFPIQSSYENGKPSYYAISLVHPTMGDFTGYNTETLLTAISSIHSADGREFNAIIFNVPAEGDLTVAIKGLFYSPLLINDEDVNYWSDIHPMLLVMAAIRQTEVLNRNIEGIRTWTESIMNEIKEIGQDWIEEESATALRMEG